MKFIRLLFRDNIYSFLLIRYLNYGLQFALIYILAKQLNTHYFGIYSIITLYLQYLGFSTFGIPYELNVRLSVMDPNKDDQQTAFVNNAFSKVFLINCALGFVAIILSFSGYRICKNINNSVFIILIMGIVFLQSVTELFMNIFRARGKMWMINLSQFLPVFGQILGLLIGRTQMQRLLLMLIFQFAGLALYCFLAFLLNPISVKRIFYWTHPKWNISIRNSLYLLFYNLSYVLILLSSRTFVSNFFSVSEFGIYSFASSIANIITIALGSIAFAFFSKMVSKLNIENNKLSDVKSRLYKSRKLYLLLMLLFTLFGLVILPWAILMVPNFKGSEEIIGYFMFTQLILGNIFAYGPLLISNSQTKILIVHGIMAAIIIMAIATLFAFGGLPLHYQAIATIFGALYYMFAVIYSGEKLLNNVNSIKSIVLHAFPAYSFFFILAAFLITLFQLPQWCLIILLIGFILSSLDQLKAIFNMSIKSDLI